MTAKGTTKQEILEAALELFSVQGYEATSISQLAKAVGIRKASLYSHFENKQAILDALIQTTTGAFSKIIATGIIAVSVMSSVLLFDHLRLYDFIIDGALIYILFFKKIKRLQKRKDWDE